MEQKKVYETLQAKWVKMQGVKVGTKVNIIRTNAENEFGSMTAHHIQKELDESGTEGVVSAIGSLYLEVKMDKRGNHFILPFTALEVIGEPRETITIDGKEYSEHTVRLALQEYVK